VIASAPDGTNEISGKQDTIPEALKPAKPDMVRLRRMFDSSREATSEARAAAEKFRDYFDGKQLDSNTLRILGLRKQPPIWTNRIRPAINGVLGTLIAAKADPRAYPRNPSNENEADVISKVLRFIADTNRFDQTKIDCAENHQVEGICACIIEADGDDVPVSQVRYEEFFYDPYSRRHDFKDAKYLGIAKWMYAADVQALYPEAYQEMGDPIDGAVSGLEATWGDRPDNTLPWIDKAKRRLMVVEVYYREGGEWMRCVYCAAGVFDHQVSPYRDDRGHSVCPIEATSCYVARDNTRYSGVRDMIPIQDEINASRSRALHLMNSRQVQQSDPQAAPVDPTTAREEAARADGVIPAGWSLVPTSDMTAGNMERMKEAKAEIERMGPTPAILGRTGAESQSGRARQILQAAGMTELSRPLGHLEDWEERVYRQMWFRAKQYWTGPRFVRISADQNAPQFLALNKPVMAPVQREVPLVHPETQEPVPHPETGYPLTTVVQSIEPIGYENQISEMDADIILDTVQDTANLAQEVWADLLQLAQTVPIGSPQFMIALELSPLPNKAEIIEKIKTYAAQQQSGPDPVEQAGQQLALQTGQAKLEQTQASTQKDLATAARTRAEAETMLTGATDQAMGSGTTLHF
jgi:hypothetical protein